MKKHKAGLLVGTVEAILGKELFEFVLSPAVFFNLLFLGRAIFFTALEIIWPARKLSYLPVIWRASSPMYFLDAWYCQ